MQLRRYRYKLKVKGKRKEEKLWKFAGAYRLIYNLGLLQREFFWWQRRERTTYAKQCAELVELKKEFSWLCEIHSQALQQALRDLNRAYRNYFAGRANYPKLKKKKNHLSLTILKFFFRRIFIEFFTVKEIVWIIDFHAKIYKVNV